MEAVALLMGVTWLTASCAAAGPLTALDSWTVHGLQTAATGVGDVAYGNGIFVAYAEYGASVSESGTTWVGPVQSSGGRPLCYGAGKFVSVPYGFPMVFLSTNGLKWDWRLIEGLSEDTYFSAMAYGRGRYLAVGTQGQVGMSTDGIHWTNWVAESAWGFRTITFGKGLFAVGGSSAALGGATVWLSGDGKNWQARVVHPSNWVASVAYGRGRFVAVVRAYGAWTSSDGLQWRQTLAVPAAPALSDVAYGNGVFVCTGSSGAMYTSTDGEVWQQRQSGVSFTLYGAAFGKGTFVVAGNEKMLLSAAMPPHVTSVAFRLGETFRLPDGAMLLTIEAPYGREVVVEASEDLANWKEIARDPCDRGEFEVYDEAAKDLKQRYYRARQAAP
jgi:hypothetical protein